MPGYPSLPRNTSQVNDLQSRRLLDGDDLHAELQETSGEVEDLELAAVRPLLLAPNWVALTVAELNPDHGKSDGSTLRIFAEALADALAASPRWQAASAIPEAIFVMRSPTIHSSGHRSAAPLNSGVGHLICDTVSDWYGLRHG